MRKNSRDTAITNLGKKGGCKSRCANLEKGKAKRGKERPGEKKKVKEISNGDRQQGLKSEATNKKVQRRRKRESAAQPYRGGIKVAPLEGKGKEENQQNCQESGLRGRNGSTK